MQFGNTDNARFGVRDEDKNLCLVYYAGPCPFSVARQGNSRFIFGKTRFGPILLMTQSIMRGPGQRFGQSGGVFMGGDKPPV